jgi:hypothetical protein
VLKQAKVEFNPHFSLWFIARVGHNVDIEKHVLDMGKLLNEPV